jgi:hypothetical protein
MQSRLYEQKGCLVETAAIVIAVFAVVIIVVAVAFRQRIRTVIKGPGGAGLELDASNPTLRPGVEITEAKSRQGGLTAKDQTGRGTTVRQVEVEKDIRVSSTPPPAEPVRPNPRPPA